VNATDATDAADLLAPGGGLARAIPHYEDRAEQRAMADAVERALADARPLLVEAGTGTGKTLAYLVPALRSGKRVVVSTGTRALQDQIWRHDVPLLREIIGREFSAVVLKGVANYVCRRRLAEISSRDGTADVSALLDWARHTTTGDRAEVEWLAESAPIWAAVTVTPETRIGPRCPHFETCFATKARRAADAADLILVNHHLYFSDLALRHASPGARILPDHDAVIFDEAHQLEDVATEHFGARVSTVRIQQLVRDATVSLSSIPLFATYGAIGDAAPIASTIADVDRAGIALFAAAREALVRAGAGAEASFDGTKVPMPPGLFDGGEAQRAWFRMDTALEDLARAAETESDPEPGAEPDDSARAQALGLLARRARALREDLAAIAEQRQASRVYWCELRATGTFLTASPIHVGELVRKLVLDAGPTAVLTSATLTAAEDGAGTEPAGSFRFIRDRLGLDEDRVDELMVPSPFDYARQAMLYLPRDLPEPAGDGFGERAAARITELLAITAGRAFVLFTSHRALRDAERRLRPVLPYPLLVQGEQPRASLVARFRATPGAVLLGTGSFWEGVDVPGDALSLVIMDKLPFAPHTDPLVAARMNLVAEKGGDPFALVQLPAAALALKQGFGRLIRRRDDRGIVAVLDPRIVTRRYGRAFVASLPPALPRTSVLEQVRRWWTRARAESMV
jgi:ATP-dependent DNA helicase DinG